MKINWERILIIITFVAAIILFGFFIYWFFWRPFLAPDTTPTSTPTGTLTIAEPAGTRTTTPVTAETGLTAAQILAQLANQNPAPGTEPNKNLKAEIFVDGPAYYSFLTNAGKMNYYNPTDGKFYEADKNGKIKALSDKNFFQVSNAIFDYSGSKAVIQYPDGSNIVYDFAGDRQYTLPKHWQDFSFSHTDSQIAFKNIGLDIENRFLVAAKYDGSQTRIIDEIGINANKVTPNWSPNNQVVATYVEGLDANRSEVFFIGQNNENFKSIIVEGRDFNGLWSPSGEKMLYSVYDPNNDYKPTLWVSDAYGNDAGSNRKAIALQTWADKCTFASENFALCAVPDTMPYGAGLDRTNLTKNISDSIWAINLTNGTVTLVTELDNIKKVNKIFFNPDDPNTILIASGEKQYLYKVNLNQ